MNAKTYILYGLPWLLLIDRYSHIHHNCEHIGRQCYLKTPHCCMVVGERRTYARRKWSGLVIGRHISHSRLLQSHFELPANYNSLLWSLDFLCSSSHTFLASTTYDFINTETSAMASLRDKAVRAASSINSNNRPQAYRCRLRDLC